MRVAIFAYTDDAPTLDTGVTTYMSERIARRGFYIPSGMALNEEQIECSAAAVREILQ